MDVFEEYLEERWQKLQAQPCENCGQTAKEVVRLAENLGKVMCLECKSIHSKTFSVGRDEAGL